MALPTTNLEAQWETDSGLGLDGGGNAATWDDVITGERLVDNGMPSITTTPTNEDAILFVGNQKMHAPNTAMSQLPNGNNPRSIVAVFRVDRFDFRSAIVEHGISSTDRSFGIGFDDSGNLAALVWGNDVVSSVDVDGTGWFVVIATHDGTTVRLYNGTTEVASGARTLDIPTDLSSHDFRIGTEVDNGEELDGAVAAVFVYSKVLDATERADADAALTAKYISASDVVAVGQAVETDTARPVTPGPGSVTVNIGQAVETDTALAIAAAPGAATGPLGQAVETDTANPITATPGATTAAVGQATETDTARPVTPSTGAEQVNIGLATEVDTARAVTPTAGAATAPVGQAVETDTARPVDPVVAGGTVPVGQAQETDTALPITATPGPVVVVVAQAGETDTAATVTAIPAGAVVVGQALETDTAQTIAPDPGAVAAVVAQAIEVDTARPVAPAPATVVVVVGQAPETETAHPIAVQVQAPTVVVGQAVEVDTALAIGVGFLGTHPEALASSDVYSVNVLAAPDGQTVMAVSNGSVVRYWAHPGWTTWPGDPADLVSP